jgi:hypothetical protein
MPLKKNALDERVGDPATHFFKSGNIIRNPANDALKDLFTLLPKGGPQGTRLEYDVWYDPGDPNRVHGYVYTDIMTQFLYLRAAGVKWSHGIMRQAAEAPVTPRGEELLEKIAESGADKYLLRRTPMQFPFVVFLAGTNIINEATDFAKLENAVKQGAKLKCHPLTAPPLFASLKQRFGAENVLDKKLSGHALLNSAAIVGCTDNSEMGIVALAKGKSVYRFGPDNKRQFTYSAIYNAIWGDESRPSKLRLARILSAPFSGLIPVHGDDQQQRIDRFFGFYQKVPHVPPRSAGN